MSNMEEEPILDTPTAHEELLANLDHEPPKPLLLLVAIILGSLSMILSLVAIVQTKQEGEQKDAALIGALPVDGGVGLDNLLERMDAVEQKISQLSSLPTEFNGTTGGGSTLEHEVGTLRTELEAIRAKLDNLRIGVATSPSRPAATTGSPASATSTTTPPPVPAPTRPPAPTLTVPPGGKVHTLESGETLSALSKKYGVPLSKIESANQGLDFRKLQIGQKIVIPAPE
jgi:LysM repeat protein